MANLTRKELAALAMHELMVREQKEYANRNTEQQLLKLKPDRELKQIVETGFNFVQDVPTPYQKPKKRGSE